MTDQRTYQSDDLDTDTALRFAGSLDNGETDVEHTLPPYKCASDETYATRAEVQELEERITDVVRRLRNLDRPTMDSDGVLISHDAWDILQRDAAIGASVPWEALSVIREIYMDKKWPARQWMALHTLVEYYDAHAPKEAAE